MSRPSHPATGRLAIVTDRAVGCEGRRGVRRALARRARTFMAYGEVVWSWRRDPGVKLRGKSHAGDGGKKGRFTGESTKYTVKPSRGEGRDVLAEPVVITLVCSFVLHARLRVQLAPGLPCALCKQRGDEFAEPGRNRAAGIRACASSSLRGAKRRPV